MVGPNPKTLGGGIHVGKRGPQDHIPQTGVTVKIGPGDGSLGSFQIIEAAEGKAGEGNSGPEDHSPILGEGHGHHRLHEGDIHQPFLVGYLAIIPLKFALHGQKPKVRKGIDESVSHILLLVWGVGLPFRGILAPSRRGGNIQQQKTKQKNSNYYSAHE